MASPTRTRRGVRTWIAGMGVSLCLCAAVALGPGLPLAGAAQTAAIEVEIESICAALGDLAWAAYIAKDYKLLAEIDAAMQAIGCFD